MLALKLVKSRKDFDVELKPTILQKLGKNYVLAGNKSKAVEYLNDAHQVYTQHPGLENNFIPTNRLLLGEAYEDEPQKALFYLQHALTATSFEFSDSTNYATNPSLDQTIFSKTQLLKILTLKGKALAQVDRLDHALSTYRIAVDLVDDLRQNYLAEGSKLILQEQAIELYEGAIAVALQLDKKELAWQFSESSKAALLVDNITDAQARFFAGVDTTLLKTENALKMETGMLESKLYRAKNKQDTNLIERYKARLFENKRTHEKLLEDLKQQHPRYHELHYQKPNFSLALVQKELSANEAIIEYFFGEEKIYCFSVTADQVKTYVLSNPESTTDTVQHFLHKLQIPTGKKSDFIRLSHTAHWLYKSLLAPAINDFPEAVNELTVIPDGPLGYIPFQALVKNTPPENTAVARYDLLDFLVKNYRIGYTYSVCTSRALDRFTTKILHNDLIGIAPGFNKEIYDKDNVQLGKLLFNQEEVRKIGSITGGVVFTDSLATVQCFRNNLDRYKLMHISTHASLNNESPLNSKIYFHDDYFTVGQIYGLPVIQSRLMVLSACNTGTGQLRRGEGVMSLSRAFMYAGCPALLTSLWQVDDQKTVSIMTDFYKGLYKGKSQTEALWASQNKHLKNISSLKHAHPFYWAGFIHIGNKKVLFEAKQNWKLYSGMSGFVIILLFIFTKFAFAAKKKSTT